MASSAARCRTSTPNQLSGSLINFKTTPNCADGPWTSVSRRGPEDVQLGRLAEDEAGGRRPARRIEAQARQALQQAADGRVRLEAREVHPDAHVRPAREGEVLARVLAPRVEAVGVGERARVAVG